MLTFFNAIDFVNKFITKEWFFYLKKTIFATNLYVLTILK